MRVLTRVYSSPTWAAHLRELGQVVGLNSQQDVLEEAVRMLAEAAGLPPVDRYPGTRLQASKLNVSRLIKNQ
jgi:hypothetical protein